MNTLIAEVTRTGQISNNNNNEIHWTFDWVQPIKPSNGVDGNTANNILDPIANNLHSGNSFIVGSNEHNKSRTNLNRSNSNLFQLDNIDNNTTKEADGNDNNDDSVERYPFRVKMWVKTLKQKDSFINPLDLVENDTLQPIDLDLFDRTKISNSQRDQTKIALEKNKRIDEDGLTEKDIRGAVAGSGSIPGLSSNDGTTDKKDNSTPAPAAPDATANTQTNESIEAPVVESVEPSVTPAVVETSVPVESVDSTMTPAVVESSITPTIESVESTNTPQVESTTTPTPTVESIDSMDKTSVGTMDKEGDIDMK